MFGADIQNFDIQNFGKFLLPEKIKLTHSFFIGLDEGTTKILRCSFVHPNTEQLPCFARLQAMMSLVGKKNAAVASHGCSSFSHGQAKFSGRAKQ